MTIYQKPFDKLRVTTMCQGSLVYPGLLKGSLVRQSRCQAELVEAMPRQSSKMIYQENIMTIYQKPFDKLRVTTSRVTTNDELNTFAFLLFNFLFLIHAH